MAVRLGEIEMMKSKFASYGILLLILPTLLLAPILTASATQTPSDMISGTVYENGVPKAGLTVHVYRTTTLNGAPGPVPTLEGYSTTHPGDAAWLGTDVTDANGHFSVSWLYAYDNAYTVKVVTSTGTLTQNVPVLHCFTPVSLTFNYNKPTCNLFSFLLYLWQLFLNLFRGCHL